MAHLFRQIYVDEVDFEEITPTEVIEAIFTEFVHRQMKELRELQNCQRETDVWKTCRDCREVLVDEELWWNLADKAIDMIDREYIWQAIVEAFKILKYPEPSAECRGIFEQLYSLSCLGLYSIYEQRNGARPSLEYLIDYVICVCKLKYQLTV